MIATPLSTLLMLIHQVAYELNIDKFQVQCLFQHAVYTGRLNIDLTQRIELYRPLPVIRRSNAG